MDPRAFGQQYWGETGCIQMPQLAKLPLWLRIYSACRCQAREVCCTPKPACFSWRPTHSRTWSTSTPGSARVSRATRNIWRLLRLPKTRTASTSGLGPVASSASWKVLPHIQSQDCSHSPGNKSCSLNPSSLDFGWPPNVKLWAKIGATFSGLGQKSHLIIMP